MAKVYAVAADTNSVLCFALVHPPKDMLIECGTLPVTSDPNPLSLREKRAPASTSTIYT